MKRFDSRFIVKGVSVFGDMRYKNAEAWRHSTVIEQTYNERIRTDLISGKLDRNTTLMTKQGVNRLSQRKENRVGFLTRGMMSFAALTPFMLLVFPDGKLERVMLILFTTMILLITMFSISIRQGLSDQQSYLAGFLDILNAALDPHQSSDNHQAAA